MVADSKATSIIANGIREESVRKKGVITSKANKKKGDTLIKK